MKRQMKMMVIHMQRRPAAAEGLDPDSVVAELAATLMLESFDVCCIKDFDLFQVKNEDLISQNFTKDALILANVPSTYC